ncbi:MAG TPA: NnrS family protein, partial [Anaeromyxobacter sp.]
MASPPQGSAPGWRREPYRLLFPLGAALAVVAVLPFPLRGMGGGSLALFHSVAQILGFLTCFVVGFLFTFVPRRTRTAPPDGWEMAVAVAVPPVAVASAWVNAGQTPYVLWLGLVVVAITFTVSRMRAPAAGAGAPAVLVWVPLSLAAGA